MIDSLSLTSLNKIFINVTKDKIMISTKKPKPKLKQKQTRKSYIPLVIFILIVGIFFAGFLTFGKGYFNSKLSEAESKHYSKTYAAGDIVEKKPIKVLNYSDASEENNNKDDYDRSIPQVNWRSVGHKIKVSTNSKGQKINGWRTRSSPYIPRMTYISKPFIIPKPENTRNRPMSIQLCWKAKSYNTSVAMTLYRSSSSIWHSASKYGVAQEIYSHGTRDSDKSARRIGCYGIKEYIFDTDDYGDPVNRQVKARIYVAVMGEPIDIVAIRVKSIPYPDYNQATMRSDFNTGKYFSDVSGQTK